MTKKKDLSPTELKDKEIDLRISNSDICKKGLEHYKNTRDAGVPPQDAIEDTCKKGGHCPGNGWSPKKF